MMSQDIKLVGGNDVSAELAEPLSTPDSETKAADEAKASFGALIKPDDEPLPDDFVEGIMLMEKALGMKVCLFLQDDADYDDFIDMSLYEQFFEQRLLQKQPDKVALLVHSPGGDPRAAYKLGKLLNETYGGYVALVPRYAKSAATLLSLGAEKIVLGTHAELGPLDMQVRDLENEDSQSALNHVQALERLSAFALDTVDQSVHLMIRRSSKKVATVLPYALDFASSMVRPLMEKIDVVKYTEMSRILKVGEEYAVRLMQRNYGERSRIIATKLVSEYPEHGFVIDHLEAKKLGIRVELPKDGLAEGFTKVMPYMGSLSAFGTLKEVERNESNA